MKKYIFILGMSLTTAAYAQQTCESVFNSIKFESLVQPYARRAVFFDIASAPPPAGRPDIGVASSLNSSDGTLAYSSFTIGGGQSLIVYRPETKKFEKVTVVRTMLEKSLVLKDRFATVVGESQPPNTPNSSEAKQKSFLVVMDFAGKEKFKVPSSLIPEFSILGNFYFERSQDRRVIRSVDVLSGAEKLIKLKESVDQVHAFGDKAYVRTSSDHLQIYDLKTGSMVSTLKLDKTEYIHKIAQNGAVITKVWSRKLQFADHDIRGTNDVTERKGPPTATLKEVEAKLQFLRIGNEKIKLGEDEAGVSLSISNNYRYISTLQQAKVNGVPTPNEMVRIYDTQKKAFIVSQETKGFRTKPVGVSFKDLKTGEYLIFDYQSGKTLRFKGEELSTYQLVGIAPDGNTAILSTTKMNMVGDDLNSMWQSVQFFHYDFHTAKLNPVLSLRTGLEALQFHYDGKSMMILDSKKAAIYNIEDAIKNPHILQLNAGLKTLNQPATAKASIEALIRLYQESPTLAISFLKSHPEVLNAKATIAAQPEKLMEMIKILKDTSAFDVQSMKDFIQVVKSAKGIMGQQGKDVTTELANLVIEVASRDEAILSMNIPQYNLFKMVKESLRKDFGLEYSDLQDIFTLRKPSEKVALVIAIGTKPIDGEPLNAYGFAAKVLNKVSNEAEGNYQLQWKSGEESLKANLKVSLLDVSNVIPPQDPSPNYQLMLSDKNIGGMVVITKNLADFASELGPEYLAYYKQNKFKFSEPKTMTAPQFKEALAQQIKAGKLDYLVREGHSEFSTELAMTFSAELQIHQGSRAKADGTTETVLVVIPSDKMSKAESATISYAEIGDQMRLRPEAEAPLMFLQTSCSGHGACKAHINDTAAKGFIPLSTTALSDTFTNEPTSQIYQIVDGIRHMKSYEQIRQALKKTEDPDAYRFPDQKDYLADQDGDPDKNLIRMEIDRKFTVETPGKVK